MEIPVTISMFYIKQWISGFFYCQMFGNHDDMRSKQYVICKTSNQTFMLTVLFQCRIIFVAFVFLLEVVLI